MRKLFVPRSALEHGSFRSLVVATDNRRAPFDDDPVSEQLGNDGWAAEVAAALGEDLVFPIANHRRLRPLLVHLLSNLSERFWAKQGAKIVNVERKYFSRLFERETGFKFSWWIREVKIRIAARLLEQNGHNIESVALAVGYDDATTFERAFKKCKGVGPRAYRRSLKSPRAVQ